MNEQANMTIRYEREIPEGYEARIEGNKVIIELKESEDERIRKAISYAICAAAHQDGTLINDVTKDEAIAYLERQKEQKPRDESGTAEPDYGICDSYIPAALHHALKRHGWYACHIGEDDEIIKERRDYVARNWPADKDTLTQDQQPAEWSEEDEQWLESIIKDYEDSLVKDKDHAAIIEIKIDFLKSLRHQPHWKPSEKQLIELRHVISGCSFEVEAIIELEKQLQKLL